MTMPRVAQPSDQMAQNQMNTQAQTSPLNQPMAQGAAQQKAQQMATPSSLNEPMGTPTVTNHTNKSYKMAQGGTVPSDDSEGETTGMIPGFLRKAWGYIPSPMDMAVTGKVAASPEEYDKAKAAKDAAIDRRSK